MKNNSFDFSIISTLALLCMVLIAFMSISDFISRELFKGIMVILILNLLKQLSKKIQL